MQSEVLALQAPAQFLAGILDRMLDGIAIVDASDRIRYRNPAAAALLPAGQQELPGFLARITQNRWSEVEIAPLRFVEVSSVPIVWESAPAKLMTFRDVTERHRRQASLVVLTEELRSANERLRMMADVDALTGLLNRRGLKRILDAEILPRMRLGFDLAAIMIDCDEFKAVNDSFDHVTGDFVLRQVADRLRIALRPSDPLARVGGDEFLVLLPGARHADALRAANRIREAVASGPIAIPWLGREVALTVSVGVAKIPRHVRDADDIVIRADARLRQSKRAGKNRVTGPAPIPEGPGGLER